MGTELSPRKRRAIARRRRAEELSWSAKCGPVTVTRITVQANDNRTDDTATAVAVT